MALLGSAKIGLAHDFDQGNTGAVEVDVGPRVRVGEALVERLARVLFEVHARNSDPLAFTVHVNFEPAVLS